MEHFYVGCAVDDVGCDVVVAAVEFLNLYIFSVGSILNLPFIVCEFVGNAVGI
jgi:hypothetical protein